MNSITWEQAHKQPQILEDENGEPQILFYNNMDDYNYWIGHTNFIVDKTTIEKLKHCLGVERATNASKYRFVVAIGKAFGLSEVKSNIEEMLCHNSIGINTQLLTLKNRCLTNTDGFGIMLPNGRVIFAENKKNREYIKNLIKLKNISNGIAVAPKKLGVL